jgi:hypothetical protein
VAHGTQRVQQVWSQDGIDPFEHLINLAERVLCALSVLGLTLCSTGDSHK